MSTLRAQIAHDYARGIPRAYYSDNCTVHSQSITPPNTAQRRDLNILALEPTSPDLLLSLGVERIRDPQDAPNPAFRVQRGGVGILPASPAPPGALSTLTFDMGTQLAGAATFNQTAANTFDEVDIAPPRFALGVMLHVALVAPDTAAGGFPGIRGELQIRHSYGSAVNALRTQVSYKVNLFTCKTDSVRIFLPFINAGPGGDQPIIVYVPGLPAFNSLTTINPFASSVLITGSYGMPQMRITAELLLLDSLFTPDCDNEQSEYLSTEEELEEFEYVEETAPLSEMPPSEGGMSSHTVPPSTGPGGMAVVVRDYKYKRKDRRCDCST